MTNRGQIIRSSTKGAIPAAATRAAGELWTNFPDLQLGIIDTSRNAQKLLAVRYFSTGADYAAGDFVIQAGALYVAKGAITAGAFNATQWTKVAAATDAGGPYLALAGGTLVGDLILNRDPQVALGAATRQYVDGAVSAAPFLPIAGGTLTGKLILSGPPTASLDAATKAYVDAGAFVPVGGGSNTGLNDNRIINGDMRIDQRNNGASGTANGYTVDRWQYSGAVASKGTWSRGAFNGLGFPYAFQFTSSSAYAVAAGDTFAVLQLIEADMVSDFQWGTAQAQSVTLSFIVYSSVLTGMFGGAIRNSGSTRSYPFSFTVPAANAAYRISITIPGDTAGTWVMSGTGAGLNLSFNLGAGATYSGPANAWAGTNYVAPTGAVSVVGTNAATFYLTGIKLEVGSVATPYNRQSLAKSLADCQRYYQSGSFWMSAAGVAGQSFGSLFAFCTAMRAAPTIPPPTGSTNINITGLGVTQISSQSFIGYGTATTGSLAQISANYTASAEL